MTMGSLLLIFTVVIFLWNTRVVYPLKILVVFFHELSHGLMALMTGGAIERIEVVAQQGGLCRTRGGNRFLILSAGYLGSLLWGGAILMLATRTDLDKSIMGALGGLMVVITLLWVRPLPSFGFSFGLLSGLAMLAAGFYVSGGINDYALKVVGLTSCLYAVLDIKSDILDRPKLRSDAHMLAEHTGVPTLVWGLLWITIAVAAALFFLLGASRKVVPGI